MRIIIYILFLCAAPVVGFGQAIQSLDTQQSCTALVQIGRILNQNGRHQEAYDTLQRYFDQCALENESWVNFNEISLSNQQRTTSKSKHAEFREWLKKVLYYNPDYRYYCADVGAMFKTFAWFNDERGEDINGSNAVLKYLIESGKCTADSNDYYTLIELYNKNRQWQIQHWKDTVHDSIATPIDTTLPSLEDLGLGILRGNPNEAVSPASSEEHIGELIATRNPFTDILELKYRLSKGAMTRIDVYDLLGRAVYSEGQGYKAEGEHVLSLQSKGWSSGSYYVRLSSPSGEVKTVKVVKE